MARETTARTERDAPPVTRLLGAFVATHPAQGFDAAIEHEALRTLLNYLGCAIGAAHHPTALAALAAALELAPAPQATLYGRSERVDMPRSTAPVFASAARCSGLTRMALAALSDASAAAPAMPSTESVQART